MESLDSTLLTGCTDCGSYSLQTECQDDEQELYESGYLLRCECRSCGLTQWTQECSEEDYNNSTL